MTVTRQAEGSAIMGAMAVAAVVVNWNGGDALLDTLRSLDAHPPAGGWDDVVVVDNASTDGSPERVAEALPWVRLVRNDDNRGLAAATNQGIAATAADLVLLCNPDIVVGQGAVDALADVLARHPRAAWAIARLRRPDGSIQTSVGDLPTFGEALLGRRWQVIRRRAGGFWWDGWAHDEERRVDHGMEACYLVRRRAADDIGPLDEGFPLDWEGIDWSDRARAAGWEIWFTPAADVVHLGGVSVRQVRFRWVVRSHRGMYRYFATRSARPVRPLLAVAVAVRAAVKLVAMATGAWSYRHGLPDSVSDAELADRRRHR